VSLLSIFATAILPIVAIAAAGFGLGRVKGVDAGPLNTVIVYVLVPALVFHSMATTQLGGRTLLAVGVGVFAFTTVMTLVAEGVGRLIGETEPLLGTFVLVSVFANGGNYGIPVAEFAFGATGRSTAVVYIVAQSVVMYTLGVYLAARGNGQNWTQGVRTVFSIPLVYAVVAAIAARWLGLLPPADAASMETLKLVGDSAIPLMLLILGVELADTEYGSALRRVSPAAGLKLFVAPVVATGIALAIGFQNQTVARVFILECAMPTAVTTLILTGEFAGGLPDGLDPAEFASTTIFLTTLVSVPLLTAWIALLESGVIV
jgi:hypothetical protein